METLWAVIDPDGKERTESEKQAIGFRLWREGGCKTGRKTFVNIANKTGVGDRTAWRWKRDFRWSERDVALTNRVELDFAWPTEESVENSLVLIANKGGKIKDIDKLLKEQYLAIIDMSVKKYKLNLEIGVVKITSPRDFETLIRTRLMILSEGKPASGGKGTGDVVINVITGIPRPEDKEEVVIDAEVVEVEDVIANQESVNE